MEDESALDRLGANTVFKESVFQGNDYLVSRYIKRGQVTAWLQAHTIARATFRKRFRYTDRVGRPSIPTLNILRIGLRSGNPLKMYYPKDFIVSDGIASNLLKWSAQGGNVDGVQSIINLFPHVNRIWGLVGALQYRQYHLIKLFGSYICGDGKECLSIGCAAVQSGDANLIRKYASPNMSTEELVRTSVRYGHLHLLKKWERDILRVYYPTITHEASFYGHPHIIRWINGIQRVDWQRVLTSATEGSQLDVADMAIRHGASITRKIAVFAANHGMLQLFELFMLIK